MTLLMANVADFASLIERLGPEAATGILNRCFEAVSEPVYRFGGVIDRYVGDALMAVFGLPTAHEDDPARALSAAVEMQRAARSLSEHLQSEYGCDLALRIGLHSDRMVTGEVGSELKHDFTVLGDGLHVVQALEANALPGGILISTASCESLRASFRFREQPSVLPRGHAEPVPCCAYEADEAGSPSDGPVFMGRGPERRSLASTLARAQAGACLLLHVRGDSGLGKTALVRHALAEAGLAEQARIARARAAEFPVPFDLGRRLAQTLLGLHEASPSQEAVERAVHALPGSETRDPQMAEGIYHLLTGREVPLVAPLEPEHRQPVMIKLLCDLVLAHFRERLLVLVLEDMHWCDDTSATWLQAFLSRLAREGRHAWLVLTTRPGGRILPTAPRGIEAIDLKLTALAHDEALALLQSRLQGHAYPAPFVEQLLKRGAGNPRFLLALGDAFADPHAAGVLVGKTLPTTLLGHVMAALDATPLTPPGTLGLEALAVLDELATRDRLGALVAQSEGCVKELVSARLIQEADRRSGALAFTNPLLQEAAYERTLLKHRRELHQRVAAMLEVEEMPPALIAEHQVLADRAPDAAWHLMRAAEASLASYSNHEALALVEAAGTWAEKAGEACRPEVRRRIMQVRSAASAALGEMPIAVATSEGILDLTARQDPAAIAWHAHLMLRQGRTEAALTCCEEGLRLPGTATQAAHLRILEADARLMCSEYARVLELAREVEEQGEGVPPRYQAWIQRIAGVAHMRLRALEAARAAQTRALAIAQEAGDLYGAAHALNNLGSTLEAQGEAEAGARRFVQGLQLAERIGDRRLKSMLMNNLGMVRYVQGDVKAARDCFASALEAHREIQDRNGEGIALCNLGEITAALGEEDHAMGLLLEAVLVLEEVGNKTALCEAYRLLAPLKQGRGAWEEATQLAQRGWTIARESGQEQLIHAAFGSLCDLAMAQAQPQHRAVAMASARSLRNQLGEDAELDRMLTRFGEMPPT